MHKIKFRLSAFLLLMFALTYVNAGIVRAAESTSYILQTYGDSMTNKNTGVSAGYSLQGSVDWNQKKLTSTSYQIVSDGGTKTSANSSTGGSSGGSGDPVNGGGEAQGSRGNRGGSFGFTLPAGIFHPSADKDPQSTEPATIEPVVQVAAPTVLVRTVARTQPIVVPSETAPFVRSPIVETFSPSPDILCFSKTTSIGCMTVAEGVVLSRLSLLYRAEQVISSVPAFQIVRGSTFTSSLIGMRAGSITIEALFFPFGFFLRKRKDRRKC